MPNQVSSRQTRHIATRASSFARIWLGCDLVTWLRIVGPNWRRLERSQWRIVFVTTLASVCNSLLGLLQHVVFGIALSRTRPVRGPLFILGHWRSGTTVLHHLLTLDSRFGYLNNYACFAPHHFLLTEWLLRDGFDWLAPSHRPMDDLPLQSIGPQEDEFALLGMGAPSPYEAIAFPDRGLDMAIPAGGNRDKACRTTRWQLKMDRLVRALTFRTRKHLVLKSPTHTFRVHELLAMYPDAQFVHISRDPVSTVASTVAMWKSLCRDQSLASLDDRFLEDTVIDNYQAMCRNWEDVRRTLEPAQFHEIQYEQLLADPLSEMRALYTALQLGEFDDLRPEVIRHLQAVKLHQPSVHPISDRAVGKMRRCRSRIVSSGVTVHGNGAANGTS